MQVWTSALMFETLSGFRRFILINIDLDLLFNPRPTRPFFCNRVYKGFTEQQWQFTNYPLPAIFDGLPYPPPYPRVLFCFVFFLTAKDILLDNLDGKLISLSFWFWGDREKISRGLRDKFRSRMRMRVKSKSPN